MQSPDWMSFLRQNHAKIVAFISGRLRVALSIAEAIGHDVALRCLEKQTWYQGDCSAEAMLGWVFAEARHNLDTYYRPLLRSERIFNPIDRPETGMGDEKIFLYNQLCAELETLEPLLERLRDCLPRASNKLGNYLRGLSFLRQLDEHRFYGSMADLLPLACRTLATLRQFRGSAD